MKTQTRTGIIFCLVLIVSLFSCDDGSKQELVIFHAGSLSVPLKQASLDYMEKNPLVSIKLEGAGSVACARKITELGRKCDIMASADYKVIDKFLIPEYAKWNISFATNEMVVAFNESSVLSDSINPENWYDILLNKDVTYGRADPNADPCGYRTVMMFRLAEKYYRKNDLTVRLTTKDRNMIRPKEVDLVALLETNSLDYIIQYKSVCEQHGLDYLSLPDDINLSNPAMEELYNAVSVKITGNAPGTKVSITGSSMVYGLTIPENAPNRELAVDFLDYFLGDEGQQVLLENGQTPLAPKLSGSNANLPEKLLELLAGR